MVKIDPESLYRYHASPSIAVSNLQKQESLNQETHNCGGCLYFHKWQHLESSNAGVCRFSAITCQGFPGTVEDNWCGEWVPK